MLVFGESDAATMEVSAIQLLDRVSHVLLGGEVHNAGGNETRISLRTRQKRVVNLPHVAFALVRVRVGHFTSRTHEVFQVLWCYTQDGRVLVPISA